VEFKGRQQFRFFGIHRPSQLTEEYASMLHRTMELGIDPDKSAYQQSSSAEKGVSEK
jgi:hypothetical protein